jgi:phospholipid-transporting ATPase
VNDEHLLERYDIDDSEQPYTQTQPRPSVSYDNFVGSRAPPGAMQHNVASGPAHPPANPSLQPNDPYSSGTRDRAYSQYYGLEN